MRDDLKMDQQWLDEQTEELGEALAQQGLSLAVPMLFGQRYDTDKDVPIASMIDHTQLKPDTPAREIDVLCQEALAYQFASVCVNPRYVALAAAKLQGSSVKTCTVIGFPLGASTTLVKVLESRDALANGADELDMVIAVGRLKEGAYADVYRDISNVVEAASGRVVKVILETSLLTKEEIVKGCILAKMAGADFVKTSTGFGGGGAAIDDIRLMRHVVGSDMGVKASGGIRDRATALRMVEAGASRIGASAGVAIVEGAQGKAGY